MIKKEFREVLEKIPIGVFDPITFVWRIQINLKIQTSILNDEAFIAAKMVEPGVMLSLLVARTISVTSLLFRNQSVAVEDKVPVQIDRALP
ncbi:MAG: hypothetical protein NT163_06125 [Chlorobiales bacterium]|nr:hypothetical protein [Chlorobiales bacterium]